VDQNIFNYLEIYSYIFIAVNFLSTLFRAMRPSGLASWKRKQNLLSKRWYAPVRL